MYDYKALQMYFKETFVIELPKSKVLSTWDGEYKKANSSHYMNKMNRVYSILVAFI